MTNMHLKLTAVPERDLVELAQAGDHQAFASLVGRHHSRLQSLALRVLRDGHRADDALQEAYLKAFRNIGRFRADATVATWLYRITYNACLDELRRRRYTGAPIAEETEAACTGTGPAEAAVATVELGELLDRLGPDLAPVVVLVHGYGLDYAGASTILGVPEGTIASRLNRARIVARRSVHPVSPQGEMADAA